MGCPEECNARCCKEFSFPIAGNSTWIKEFVEFFTFTHPDMLKYRNGSLVLTAPCIYLENNKCGIYDRRPKICREFLCKQLKQLTLEREKNG
jgi:uncharacterized protein